MFKKKNNVSSQCVHTTQLDSCPVIKMLDFKQKSTVLDALFLRRVVVAVICLPCTKGVLKPAGPFHRRLVDFLGTAPPQ